MKSKFINALKNVVSTVSVITSNGDAGIAGATISSFCSVSADPASLLACIFKETPLSNTIKKNKRFCINLLSQEQIDVSDVFAGRETVPSKNRFDLVDWNQGQFNQPILNDSVASFECSLSKSIDGNTHEIFIGHVISVVSGLGTIEPLVYCKQKYAKALTLDNSNVGLNKLMLELL